MRNNLTIYKANELIEATYTLAINEQRVLLACIAQINPTLPINALDKYTLLAKDFAQTFKLDERGAYDELLNVAQSLREKAFIIQNPTTSGADGIKTSWISGIEYTKGSGTVSVWLSQPLLNYLVDFKEKFTRYELRNVSGMRSYYGIRIYELLAQYRKLGKREIKIDWLKERLEITHLYQDLSNFKKFVIKAATDDIEKNSDLLVHTTTYTKTGRNTTGVIFEFCDNPKSKQNSLQSKKNFEPKAKPITQAAPIDNVEHYASLLKRSGGDARQAIIDTMPPEVKKILVKRGIL
jgi:plasmid replication initiation protein